MNDSHKMMSTARLLIQPAKLIWTRAPHAILLGAVLDCTSTSNPLKKKDNFLQEKGKDGNGYGKHAL